MRILPVQCNNKINFKSSIPANHDMRRIPDDTDNKNNEQQPKPLPEWARKAMLFTVIAITLKNEPVVQNLFHQDKQSEKDIARDEFFEDVQKIRKEKETSPAFYHLNRLYDIERPKIKALGNSNYSLEINLDKQKIQLVMHLDENNKDTITGKFRTGDNGNFIKYKAVFSPENKNEFKILLNDNGKKCILGRDFKGELYIVKNNKKEILNNSNVEKYENYLETLETLDDLKFFTNSNPLWRNLNYLLLIFLVYNEYCHDKARKKKDSEDKEV